MSPRPPIDMKPATLPNLAWAAGTVSEILVQPGEKFYVFGIQQANGSTVFVRIADAHTGACAPQIFHQANAGASEYS